MDKKERFETAYNHLKYTLGVIRTQKDVADRMGASISNVSGALKGNTGILTNKFLRRFNEAFGNTFSLDWLVSGQGEMLSPKSTASATLSNVSGNNNSATATNVDKVLLEEIQAHRRQVDKLISIIEDMQKNK